MKVAINRPCNENWENMKIGLHARFCENCKKNVVDFTNMEKREILKYLLSNYETSNCGRIYPSQLDFSHTDFLVTINAITKDSKNSNLHFYLLSIGTLVLASCNPSGNSVSTQFENNNTSMNKYVQMDTLQIKKDSACTNQIENEEKARDFVQTVVLGGISIESDTTFGYTEPYRYVEIMPEFKGGMDSLASFIKENLKYPDWENENKIQGLVYVKFVVDKEGKIKDAEILRSVEKAKNFDNEVIRVINQMPDWIPGKKDGKNVDVQFHLPIKFKL